MSFAKQYLEDPRLLVFHSPLPQQTLVALGSQNILFHQAQSIGVK